MSKDFEIKIVRLATYSELKVTAFCNYIGDNEELLKTIDEWFTGVAEISVKFHKNKQQYKWLLDEEQTEELTYNFKPLNGFIHGLYNFVTGYSLHKKFPFLTKLKGISYALLLCCVCEGLKLGYIIPSSEIGLEASGSIVDPEIDPFAAQKDYVKLIEYYEKIGFHQIWPERIDQGISEKNTPMVATVEEIIKRCNFDNVSQELLHLLPLQMCKELCQLPKIPPYKQL
jgi:hypothetical protein